MKVAINQPAYLPWLGYFDLMDQVDLFILLDSVQFEKQSWQQRNRIKTPVGLQWLTVPVVFRGHFGQEVKDVAIRDLEFGRKQLRSIELNYRKAQFFDRYFSKLPEFLQPGVATNRLAELNECLIRWFCEELGIHTPIVRASEVNQPGRRSELLINLCRAVGTDSYMSPIGSASYLLADLDLFSRAGIEVTFQHYEHPVYRQLFPPFCSHASVLDLLFNHGDESAGILRSGRKTALMPHEVSPPALAVGSAE